MGLCSVRKPARIWTQKMENYLVKGVDVWKLITAKTPIMSLEATSAFSNHIARVTTTAKNTKRARQGSINATLALAEELEFGNAPPRIVMNYVQVWVKYTLTADKRAKISY